MTMILNMSLIYYFSHMNFIGEVFAVKRPGLNQYKIIREETITNMRNRRTRIRATIGTERAIVRPQ